MGAISIIITGANGRMGKTMYNFANNYPDLKVAGLIVQDFEFEAASKEYKESSAFLTTNLEEAIVAAPGSTVIDFTGAAPSLQFARICAEHGAKHVIGSTGMTNEQKIELAELAKQTPIFISPNMSIGINVLLKILPELVKLLGEEYDAEIMEIHHKLKKDSPSGTAVRLAEALAEGKGWKLDDTACYHREGLIGERPQKQIGLQTLRGGDVVGVHTAYLMGPGERIEVTHHATSRENFAQGAIKAVRWLNDKKPGKLYSMLDVMQ